MYIYLTYITTIKAMHVGYMCAILICVSYSDIPGSCVCIFAYCTHMCVVLLSHVHTPVFCMYVHVCVRTRVVVVYVCVCLCFCTHTHTHTHTIFIRICNVYVYAYVYTHTYKYTYRRLFCLIGVMALRPFPMRGTHNSQKPCAHRMVLTIVFFFCSSFVHCVFFFVPYSICRFVHIVFVCVVFVCVRARACICLGIRMHTHTHTHTHLW